MTASRSTLTIASGVQAQEQARAAAEGGIWWTARLLQQDAAVAGSAAGRAMPQELIGDEVAVSVSWTLERTKIDLNRASRSAIVDAAEAAGIGGAEAFGEAVLQRRARFAAAGIPWRVDAQAIEGVPEVFDLVLRTERPALVQSFTVHGGRIAAVSDEPRAEAAREDALVPGDVIEVEAQATHASGARSVVVALLRLDRLGAIDVLAWEDAAAHR